MKFDVTAVIKEIGPIETVGQKGFQKRNLILSEQSGQYENLVCAEFSGDKLTSPEQFSVGQTVTVSGFVNCREWNGKYFTSLRGSFISIPQAPAGDGHSQNYQGAPDMGAPAYDQPQGYSQPQAPQPAQGFAAPQGNQAPVPPPFPENDNTESVDDIPF
jgi:hypothetical protein